jgi:hypothetical protein
MALLQLDRFEDGLAPARGFKLAGHAFAMSRDSRGRTHTAGGTALWLRLEGFFSYRSDRQNH